MCKNMDQKKKNLRTACTKVGGGEQWALHSIKVKDPREKKARGGCERLRPRIGGETACFQKSTIKT